MELCIDIGGSKTASAVLDSQGNILWSHTEKTQKGKHALAIMIQHITEKASQQCPLTSPIKIATPGKLIGPHHDTIAAGTGTQLASYKHECDNLNLRTLFTIVLPNYRFFFINDAIAQFIGGLIQLDPKNFINQTVGYIGPGTGLGGGFAEIGSNGEINIITDGHIFDILIPEPAEDILSGRGILEKTGVSAQEINTLTHPKFAQTAEQLGHALAILTEKIITGTLRKQHPQNQWSDSDITAAKNTRHFLMGGSIGTHPPLSETMITTALQHLQKKGIIDIHFHTIPHQEKAAWDGLRSLK